MIKTPGTFGKKETFFLILLLSAYLLFGHIPFIPDEVHFVWERICDSGHLPLFGVITWIALDCWGRRRILRSLSVFLFICAGAALVEIAQPFSDRSATFTDLANGCVGASLALIAYALHTKRARVWPVLLPLILFASFLSLLPAFHAFRQWHEHSAQFPVLGSFESDADLAFWVPTECTPRGCTKVGISEVRALEGRGSLEVRTQGRSFGIEFKAGGRSWAGFDVLTMAIHSTGASRTIYLRIDDEGDVTEFESRYNATLRIHDGWNELRLPIEKIKTTSAQRELDITHVRRLMIFGAAEKPMSLFLDDARLVKEVRASLGPLVMNP